MKQRIPVAANLLFCIFVLSCFAEGQTLTHTTTPNTWSGNFGAGMTITNGTTNTRNFNVSLGIIRDPKKKSIIRINTVYLRGDNDDELIVDRATFTLRDEIILNPTVYVYGQGDYLRDTFKGVIYVLSPSGGFGYKFVNTDAYQFSIDTGVGGVWERDAGVQTFSNGSYTLGEHFLWKVSKSATITQSVSSLWKINRGSDALHQFNLALSASVTTHTELKIELIDGYKTRPIGPTLGKNDSALVTALVIKF